MLRIAAIEVWLKLELGDAEKSHRQQEVVHRADDRA